MALQNMVLVDSIELTSNVQTVEFTNIPSNLSNLRINISHRTDSNNSLMMRFNSSSTSIYDSCDMQAQQTATAVAGYGNQDRTFARVAYYGADEVINNLEITIFQYANTSRWKTTLSHYSGWYGWHHGWNDWRNTAAISSIWFSPESSSASNLLAGSVYSLFGFGA
jgi:hypothetical protein